jgi:hypothetical protein
MRLKEKASGHSDILSQKKIKMKISKKIHETCAAEPSLHVQLRHILGKSAGRKSEEGDRPSIKA